MGKTLSEIAQDLQSAENKVQLIYAFNGVGKTRLSRKFKELISPKTNSEEDGDSTNKILYYNAFTEDLFYWDNDLENDVDCKLEIHPNSFTDWILKDEGKEKDIAAYFTYYTNSKIVPNFSSDFSSVSFSIPGEGESTPAQIKISKSEESNFIWCVFYSMLESVIDELNETKDNRGTPRFDGLEYIFIDDPVSSLDENHLIELAVDLAKTIKTSKTESGIKFTITTHNPLFFNVLFNEFKNNDKDRDKDKNKRKYLKCYLKKIEDGTYELQKQVNDSPFAYHLYVLQELKNAIFYNSIKKYHFNLLRNLLEKTATFLGYPRWGELLKEMDDKYATRLINLSSHSSLSTDESSILTDEDKEIIKNIVDFFEKTYHFKIEPNSNVASIPTEVSN